MTCYECVPTATEAMDVLNSAVAMPRFMARFTANSAGAPPRALPHATDAISLMDARLQDIKTAWQHRCHAFKFFLATSCRAPVATGAVAAASAVPVALGGATIDTQASVGARKRKSELGGNMPGDSQPPSARMRLQQLQRAAASAILEAEEAERTQASQAAASSPGRSKVPSLVHP